MSFWRQLTRGIRALTRGSAVDRDVCDEVQHYLEQSAAEHAARGLSPDDALRAARLELGGSEAGVREQIRAYGWETAIQTTLADVRYATRRFRAEPGFTSVTVLTVALGIGATTAIFSALKPTLFESLPYPHPDRITMIWELRGDGGRNGGTFGGYRELVERTRSFDALAVIRSWQPTMTGADQPERLEGQRVSASYFDVLGAAPILGRDLQASDDRLNGPNVVILSDALWRRRFDGDPTIVGRSITLDDESHIVIGVMPRGFENVLAPSAELWAPLQYDMSQGRAWGKHLRTVGRLRPGISLEQAGGEVRTVGQSLAEQHPQTYGRGASLTVTPLQDDLTRGVRRALYAILGAVTLVLVIACVNVTNLLLARGVRRRVEFTLRAALGAGRSRLIRQQLTESLLLAALGGAAGMVVATLGVRAIVTLSPPGLPRVDAIDVDGAVLAFGLGVTTVIGLAFGMFPALQATRIDPNRDLQHGWRSTGSGHRRARSVLVVAEVALALVLLVSSGLLLRSLVRLFAVETGFDPSRVLTMQVQASSERFDNDARSRFFEKVLEAVRQVPGVAAAALTDQLPLSGDLDEYGAHFEAGPTQPARSYSVFRYGVSPGYTEAMRIPLRRGRLLDENDRAGMPRVALISESLAGIRFPGADPMGQRMRIGPRDGAPFTIVGVVGNVKQVSLALTESDAVYVPATQWHFVYPAMSVVIRAHDDAAALAPAVRQAVWSVDKDQPIVRLATMDDLLARTAAERRFALSLFEAFALAALVLAAAGIYGVLAGSVAERTREIGVRAALGASRRNIGAMVLREGLRLTGLGAAIGLVGAAAASQAIGALLFGVSPLDAVTYAGVIALLATVSTLACAVPAWRAVRVDPVTALRAE